jgi:hypothetical protein
VIFVVATVAVDGTAIVFLVVVTAIFAVVIIFTLPKNVFANSLRLDFQFIIHHSSFIIHHSSFIIHHSSFIIRCLSSIQACVLKSLGVHFMANRHSGAGPALIKSVNC